MSLSPWAVLILALWMVQRPPASGPVDRPVRVEEVLAAVGRYVDSFEQTFKVVISDERYQQRMRRSETRDGKPFTYGGRRDIRSEMLFLGFTDERTWLTIRRVPPWAATRSRSPASPEPRRATAPPTPSSTTLRVSVPFSRWADMLTCDAAACFTVFVSASQATK